MIRSPTPSLGAAFALTLLVGVALRAAVGGGIEAGWSSPIGPVVLALGAAEGGRFRVGVRAGYAF